VFSKQNDGPTVASQYARLGVSLRCANTERVRPQCGVPIPARLFFHERCARLLECLPSLQHDPNRPEYVLKVDADEDGVGGETWRSVTYGGWASQACDEMDAPIYSLREP